MDYRKGIPPHIPLHGLQLSVWPQQHPPAGRTCPNNTVVFGIKPRALNGGFHDLDAYYFAGNICHRQTNRARTAEEVED